MHPKPTHPKKRLSWGGPRSETLARTGDHERGKIHWLSATPRPTTAQPPTRSYAVDMFALLFPTTFATLTRIEQKVDSLMTAVQIQQEDLDQFAVDINTAAESISAEIQALVDSAANPLTNADVTALQTAVDNLKNLEPPHPEQV